MSIKHRLRIAIDGPAGSGKSTTARLLAKKLGYIHIDTGAMYRALTLKALRLNVDLENEQQLVELAQQTSIEFETSDGNLIVLLDGEKVTSEIRAPEVTNSVSTVSKHPKVRALMVQRQQELARNGAVVLDGRDIGTVVLPDAEVKIFLTADVSERARRRKKDLALVGIEADALQLEEEIRERDRKDSTRSASPLKIANDAIVIDTTNMKIEQKVEKIFSIVNEKLKSK